MTLVITNQRDYEKPDLYIAAQDFTNPITPPSLRFASNLSFTSTTGSGSVQLTRCGYYKRARATNNRILYAGYSVTNPKMDYAGVVTGWKDRRYHDRLSRPALLTQRVHSISLVSGSNLNVITSTIPDPGSGTVKRRLVWLGSRCSRLPCLEAIHNL